MSTQNDVAGWGILITKNEAARRTPSPSAISVSDGEIQSAVGRSSFWITCWKAISSCGACGVLLILSSAAVWSPISGEEIGREEAIQ
jgi:hypothetical protein